MIADTIDAMTTDRPYRKALSLARAIEELERYAGNQFDPALVKLVAHSPGIRRLLAPKRLPPAQPHPPPPSSRLRPAWAQPSSRYPLEQELPRPRLVIA